MCLGFSSCAVGSGRFKKGDGKEGDGDENVRVRKLGAVWDGFGSEESLSLVRGILTPDSMRSVGILLFTFFLWF